LANGRGIRGWDDQAVSIWDDLTLEQYAVMITACEEAYLVDVLGEYGMRLEWAKTADTRRSSNLDDEAKRRLIAHFANVVTDMIAQNWVEIREPTFDWDDAEPMTPEQIHSALHDEATWLARPDGEHRMVMLMTTDHWDRLAGRPDGVQQTDPSPTERDGQ
jgi:hypothetical protein